MKTIWKEEEQKLNEELGYARRTKDAVSIKKNDNGPYVRSEYDEALYQMKLRKRVPRNGRIDINELKTCNGAIINIAGQEFRRKRAAHDVQEGVLDMNVKQMSNQNHKRVF